MPARPRSIALLGGTTSWSDAALALGYAVSRRGLVEGDAIAAYERAFAARIGVRHAISFAAGRVALYALLGALGVGRDDEVLLQVPTHIVVANAIRYRGARPVYVDCRLDDYNLDLADAERKVTPRTRVLLVQHTFGIPVDLDAARALARRHGLALVEDCVHALGARYGGRVVGSLGDAAFFSTEETKTISTTMGGMAVTDDPELARAVRAFQAECPPPSASRTALLLLKLAAYHALTEPHVHRLARPVYELLGRRNPLPGPTASPEHRGLRPAGYARRLANGQAALGLRQLERLDANLRHRRAIAEIYRARLAAAGVAPPRVPPGAEPAFVRYPVWTRDRAEAVRRIRPLAVPGVWFTSVLGESLAPEYGGYEPGSCPRAELAARHLVNLPTHPRVGPRDAEAIVEAVLPVAASPPATGETA